MTEVERRDSPPLSADHSSDAALSSSTHDEDETVNVTAGLEGRHDTFMGLPIEELRRTMKSIAERRSARDFVVLPPSTFFYKAPAMDELLTWSKSRLRYTMTLMEKPLIKTALKCFRDLQRIMGDRKYGIGKHATSKRPRALDLETIQHNIELALREPAFRDELYLHALKQITNNPSKTSTQRGWEVICTYSTTFPPSRELIPVYLCEISSYHVELNMEQRAYASTQENPEDQDIFRHRIAIMENFIVTHLNKLARTGPRGYLPTIEEIEHTIVSPFRHQVFGVSLREIMQYPENRDETGLYPRILTFLSESILKLKGTSIEGIFRVPGYFDEVQMLRLRVERGNYSIEGISDPSTPASLLKLWLRELSEPIVPHLFYERCLMVGSDVDEAVRILDEIPEINRNVLKYLIKFLQVVGDPRYQPKTKMTISNLAMVFAPNVLRCPSDNPLVILANSKFEQSFLKSLINYLEE